MQTAIDSFRTRLEQARHLGGLYEALLSLTTSAVDASDLLRAQIVLGVSALDCYIHELTIIGMVAVFEGKRPPTPAFLKYRVAMESVLSSSGSSSSWFEADVRERHSYMSFQQPDNIADAVRLFSDVRLWQNVATQLALSEQDTKSLSVNS